MIVDVYRNLNNHCWSIKKGNRVIAHANCVIGFDGTFHVKESGRKRVIEQQQKNVHAFCRVDVHTLVNPVFRYDGYEQAFTQELWWRLPQGVKEVTYNPYYHESFVFKSNEKSLNWGSPIFMMGDMTVFVKEGGFSAPSNS